MRQDFAWDSGDSSATLSLTASSMTMTMTMNRDEIFEALRQSVMDVLSIAPDAVLRSGKLSELGANSMDRMEIVTLTMQALDIKVPLVQVAEVTDIEGLVSFFHDQKRASLR